MPRFARFDTCLAILVLCAIAFGALGFAGFNEEVSGGLLFLSWLLVLVTLFMLAVRLPLRGGGSHLSAWGVNALIIISATVIVIAANVGLYRHDVHFDVSREGRNTPPSQLTEVIEHLSGPLALTYFYNAGDVNALAAKGLIEIAARNHPLVTFRAIDLDKEPGLARDLGVHAYNTAVLQAGGRKVLVESTTDVSRLGYAALRVFRERPEMVCFVTGHGETFRPISGHLHYSHLETLKGHDLPGAGDVLVAEPEQLDRLQLALGEIGLETRGIVTATMETMPTDCTAVAEVGPRTPFAPGEADLMVKYLQGGGRLLLLIDPLFPVGDHLRTRLLGALGISAEPAIVIDPVNHFRTDPDKVAVPYYDPHPITSRLALTVFPQVRPIHLAQPPASVRISVLAASSQNSTLNPPSAIIAASDKKAGGQGAQALAVAAEGVWPGAASDKHFRLVLAGTSKFATNEYFSYVSNGALAVAMVRWIADDDRTGSITPKTYSLPEIVLTSTQMRDTFIVLEVLLPLATALCGVLVWWRRR